MSSLVFGGAGLVKLLTQLAGPETLVGTSQWWGNFLRGAEAQKGVLSFLSLGVRGAGGAHRIMIKGFNLSSWKEKRGACDISLPVGGKPSRAIGNMVEV